MQQGIRLSHHSLPHRVLSASTLGSVGKRCSDPQFQFTQLAQKELDYLHYCGETQRWMEDVTKK